MSRPLVGPLDQIMLSLERRPKWKVEIYDVRSSVGPDTINDIVLGNTLEAITGPEDFTGKIAQFSYVEYASDFAQTGVAVPSFDLQLVDPGDYSLDPVRTPAGLGRYLRRGNVIRMRWGDARIDEDDWPILFTGKLVGQAGVDINRPGDRSAIQQKGVGREADFLNVDQTTDDYTIGQSLNFIADDIAKVDMGLDAGEIDFASWGSQINGHLSLQFVEIPPLVAIANCMMIDGVMPRFNGEGKLTQTLGLITQNPDRVYNNRRIFTGIVRPFLETDPYNCVLVLGLAADQSKIVQELQDLITDLHITVGYFVDDQKIFVPWTEDEMQLAEAIELIIIASVNGGLNFLGGGETFTTKAATIGSGTIGANLIVSTGFAPYIMIFFGVVYVVLAAIPDAVLSFGAGITQSVGRIIQALALAIVMLLMSKIGKGQYVFRGKPFEYVYEELRGQAELPGLTSATRNKLTIMNQVLQTQTDVDTVARNTLDRQTALAALRQASMIPDILLTPDDVFTVPSPIAGGALESYQIQAIQYVGKREPTGSFSGVATLTLSELSALGKE